MKTSKIHIQIVLNQAVDETKPIFYFLMLQKNR